MLPSSALRPTLSAVRGVLARSRAKKYSYWTGTTRCLTFAAPLVAFPALSLRITLQVRFL